MKIDIYEHLRDAGMKTYYPKSQYERGGYIFTCPLCGKEISSHNYINMRSWERACERHLEEVHGCRYLDRGVFECKLER